MKMFEVIATLVDGTVCAKKIVSADELDVMFSKPYLYIGIEYKEI